MSRAVPWTLRLFHNRPPDPRIRASLLATPDTAPEAKTIHYIMQHGHPECATWVRDHVYYPILDDFARRTIPALLRRAAGTKPTLTEWATHLERRVPIANARDLDNTDRVMWYLHAGEVALAPRDSIPWRAWDDATNHKIRCLAGQWRDRVIEEFDCRHIFTVVDVPYYFERALRAVVWSIGWDCAVAEYQAQMNPARSEV